MKQKANFLRSGLLFLTLLTGCAGGGGENSNGGSQNKPSNPTSGTQNKGEIWVQIYDGGYGSGWIEKISADYEAKTGVKVNYNMSIGILDRLESDLEKSPEYDIYMSHDINWQNFAARDLLESLDDLYERDIDGTGKKFKDRLVNGAVDISKSENGSGKQHYYRVNYTQGAGGLVYNVDMFNKNGWDVPTTYEQLTALANKIVEAEIEIPGTRETVVPFTWAGSDRQYYWDYLVFEWWAQLAGMDKIDTFKKYLGPTGLFKDGYEMFNPDSYYKEFLQAYKMWYDLIAVKPANSTPSAYGNNLLQAQANFAAGKAAMMPYAQWAKFETESAMDKPFDFNIAMMKTPRAKADSPYVNYLVGFGDSIIIPSKIDAAAKERAKDFLAYLATYEACATFAEQSKGAFLAFDYTDVVLSEEANNDTFVTSIKAKLTETTTFNLVSKNEITVWNVNKVMPWVENEYYYTLACSKSSDYTAEKVGTKVYKAAKDGWSAWLRAAGLKD